jgi:hypothetical protein
MTLDAGALIAIEKGDRQLAAGLENARLKKCLLTVPSVALAQVWRGNSPRISRALDFCAVEEFDEEMAKVVGVLLAKTGTSDVVDATVVEGAARRGDVVMTSDPDDIKRLLEACERSLRVVAV